MLNIVISRANRRQLVLNKHRLWLMFLFALGALAGYLWLVPVFGRPGEIQALWEQGASAQRILRVGVIMLLLPWVIGRLIRQTPKEFVFRLILWVFVVAPLFSFLSFPNFQFLFFTLGPFIIGGSSLLCLCSLRSKEFNVWVAGVGFTAAALLALGLSRYGLEMSSYYGRPRADFGFIHPVQGASAVVMAGIFGMQLINRCLDSRRLWQRFATIGLVVLCALLLYLGQSRNTLLAVAIFVCGASFAYLFMRKAELKWLMSLCLLSLPLIMVAFAIIGGDAHSSFWGSLDTLSSYRLTAFYNYLQNLDQEGIIALFFGPNLQIRDVTFTGFSTVDSVYITLFVNSGLLTLLSFCFFLSYVALRLSKRRLPLAFGAWCAVVIFFAIDAQGVTPSNLAIFTLLAYSVRYALRQTPVIHDLHQPGEGYGA